MFFYRFLYDIAIRLYFLVINVAALWQPKAKLWLSGRKYHAYPPQVVLEANALRIWVHCASLGEFEQGRPIIEALKKQYPECYIYLTFFSPSGYEVRKNYPLADWVGYMPLDTATCAEAFIQAMQPTFALFIKYEYWYHHLRLLQQKNIPTYLVSAQFRPEEPFFKRYGAFFRQILRLYSHIFVQNQSAALLLQQIGIDNMSVTGDTRFDRVIATATQASELPLIAMFKQNKPLLVAGSTWQADEKLLCNTLFLAKEQSHANLKLIIAPHEISHDHLTKLKYLLTNALQNLATNEPENSNKPTDKTEQYSDLIAFYSQVKAMPAEQQQAKLMKVKVLIIDNIGILSNIYRYADYVYIGGGFGRGIHNILEAAVFGMPLFFGTNYDRFEEARDLIALNAAFSVQNDSELRLLLNRYTVGGKEYEHIQNISRQYVYDNSGAVLKTMHYIQANLQLNLILLGIGYLFFNY